MISKEKFVEILHKMQEVNDFVEETNSRARKLEDAIISDFFNAMSLSITHENIVVELLDNMFESDLIGWWIYELDYGRTFELGDLQKEKDGRIVNIDVSTPEKLYDYLISEMEGENE